MSRDEIGRLDPWWVINVLFYPRDSKGEFKPMPDAQPPESRVSEWEAYRIKLWKLGVPEWRIEALWAEVLRKRNGY